MEASVFTSSTGSTVNLENSPYQEVSILSAGNVIVPDHLTVLQLHDSPSLMDITVPETLSSTYTSGIEVGQGSEVTLGSEPSNVTSCTAEESHDIIPSEPSNSLPLSHSSSIEITNPTSDPKHIVQTDQQQQVHGFSKVNDSGSSSPSSETFYDKILSSRVPNGWSVSRKDKDLLFTKMRKEKVCMSLRLDCELNLHLKINGDDLNQSHQLSELAIEHVSSDEELFRILEELNQWRVCEGNGGEEFLHVYFGNSSIKDCKLNCQTMSLHSHGCLQALPPSGSKTVCTKCSLLKQRLTAAAKRKRERCRKTIHSRICNVRYLPMPEIQRRIKIKQAKLRSSAMKIKRLKQKLQDSIEREGQTVHEEDSKMFEDLIEANSNENNAEFFKLFISEQLKALKAKGKNGRRWHPVILQWCLYLKSKSSSTYDSLAKCLVLPSKRTLYKYACRNEISGKTGFKLSAIEEMKRLLGSDLREDEKYFIIMLDEMKIKEDLVYNNHTGELTGFVALNDFYNDIFNINHILKSDEKKKRPSLATHVLQLTLRGITSSFLFPFAFFGTENTTADVLYSIVWEAIEKLEVNGFRILAVVGDGASSNRKFFRLCSSNTGIPYKTENMFAKDEPRDLYFVSDAPHLIKTSRNGFSNSNFHRKTKHLTKNGQEILWTSIVDLYEEDSQNELRLLQKLLYAHIFLDSYSMMKVKYATQVLSESVASALELKDNPKLKETVLFIRIFNKFFDLCNVKGLFEGRNKKNENLCPYTSVDDPRFKWLEEDFLGYLMDWENEVAAFPKKLTAAERNKMILSKETIEGLKITALSTVGIAKFMLSKGAKFFLSSHINQDPLEQYFGRQRAATGSHDNPTLNQYGSNTVKLSFLQGVALEAKKGNITWTK